MSLEFLLVRLRDVAAGRHANRVQAATSPSGSSPLRLVHKEPRYEDGNLGESQKTLLIIQLMSDAGGIQTVPSITYALHSTHFL